MNNKGPLKDSPLYGFAYANRHYERFHLERVALHRNDEMSLLRLVYGIDEFMQDHHVDFRILIILRRIEYQELVDAY